MKRNCALRSETGSGRSGSDCRRISAPKLDYPPLRIVRFSGAALTEGVEEHVVVGVTVHVTAVANVLRPYLESLG